MRQNIVTSGSEEACSSDNAISRMLTTKDVELMIHAICQKIKPISADLLRKIYEEIPSAVKKYFNCSDLNIQHKLAPSTERIFELMFPVEMSSEVLTGKQIKGKDGMLIKLALVDKITGEVVENGPWASAKVEIVVLEANPDDNEQNYTIEEFNNKIIIQSDKTKPHFTKTKYLYLKAGVVYLHDVKLGHSAKWMTSCWCRLGARIVNNDSGVKVKEAWTKPFEVKDRRSNLYKKHYPPHLSDEVWRLDNIHKAGEPRKRLTEKKVETVQDFLFFHRIDPNGLQKLVGACGQVWKDILNHAVTCMIDDNKIYIYPSSAERVVFDAVGELKGMISDSYFLPVNDLSEDKKVCARELLRLAFRDREGGMKPFDDEASLLNQFPCKSSGTTNAGAANCSTLDVPSGCDFTDSTLDVSSMCDLTGSTLDVSSMCELTGSTLGVSSMCDLTGSLQGVSSMCDLTDSTLDVSSVCDLTDSTMDVSSICDHTDSRSINEDDSRESDVTFQRISPSVDPYNFDYIGSSNMDNEGPWQFSYLGPLDCFGDHEIQMSLLHYLETNCPGTLETELQSCLQSEPGSILRAVVLWLFRARKRVKALEDIPGPKRQRTC